MVRSSRGAHGWLALASCAALAAGLPQRSRLTQDELSNATLRHAQEQLNACKSTGRCPTGHQSVSLLDGRLTFSSAMFVDGLSEPDDLWWDADNWMSGTAGLVAVPSVHSMAERNRSAEHDFIREHHAGIPDTWELPASTLSPWALHTPDFGIQLHTGAPCTPDPAAPRIPNPYSYAKATLNGSVTWNATGSGSTSARGAMGVGEDPSSAGATAAVCQTCIVHVDTNSLQLVAMCPPGFDGGAAEVSPGWLGSRTVNGTGGWVGEAPAPTNTTSAGVGPMFPVSSGIYHMGPPNMTDAVSVHVPSGWRYVTLLGSRILTDGEAPVAVFHLPTLHLGRGTVVRTTGSYPLAFVTRASTVVNTAVDVSPGSLGGFLSSLLPSPFHALTSGPGCPHPVRDLLFTVIASVPVAPSVHSVVSQVDDGQRLRGWWTAALCVRMTDKRADAGAFLSSCKRETVTELESSLCLCDAGFLSRQTRKLSVLAEPDEVAESFIDDLSLQASAASFAPWMAPITVTRTSQLANGGYQYNVTFTGITVDVPQLLLDSRLEGRGAVITSSVQQRGSEVNGTYQLTWRNVSTPLLSVRADPEEISRALVQTFSRVGLRGATATMSAVETREDLCRWMASAEEQRRIPRQAGSVNTGTATLANAVDLCSKLIPVRAGRAYSITMTATFDDDDVHQVSTATNLFEMPRRFEERMNKLGRGGGTTWPDLFGPASSFGDVLELVQMDHAGISAAITLPVGSDGQHGTSVRVLPGHDPDVVSATGPSSSFPSHKFGTMQLWRYFAVTDEEGRDVASNYDCRSSTSAAGERSAAVASLALSLGIPQTAVCNMSVLPLLHPPPFWSFISCRQMSAPTNDSLTPSHRAARMFGGSSGAIGYSTPQELLSVTPLEYLVRGIVGMQMQSMFSWYDAFSPHSWLFNSTLSPQAWSFTSAQSLFVAWKSVAEGTLLDPLDASFQSSASLATPVDAKQFSSDASLGIVGQQLASLRHACSYGQDWTQTDSGMDIKPVLAGVNMSEISSKNSNWIGGLPHTAPYLFDYLEWHDALVFSRFNTSGISPASVFLALHNATFDDKLQPPSHGAHLPCCYGGAGGGAIAFVAGGDLTVGTSGRISVNGQAGGRGRSFSHEGMGGQGGRLQLSSGGSLYVQGYLSAQGGGVRATPWRPSQASSRQGSGGVIVLQAQSVAFEKHNLTSHMNTSGRVVGEIVNTSVAGSSFDFSLHGLASIGIRGLSVVPGRNSTGACNITVSSCDFGPVGTLTSYYETQAHGSLRSLRVRPGNKPYFVQSSHAFHQAVHAGPSIVFPVHHGRIKSQRYQYDQKEIWLSRVGGRYGISRAQAHLDTTQEVYDALSSSMHSLQNTPVGSSTILAAAQNFAASLNISSQDSIPRLQRAMWTPRCANVSGWDSDDLSCPDVASYLARPDRITLYVRIDPPVGSEGVLSSSGNNPGHLDSASGFHATGASLLPAHAWGAHIALHDDSSLPSYQAWAFDRVLAPLYVPTNVSASVRLLDRLLEIFGKQPSQYQFNTSLAVLCPMVAILLANNRSDFRFSNMLSTLNASTLKAVHDATCFDDSSASLHTVFDDTLSGSATTAHRGVGLAAALAISDLEAALLSSSAVPAYQNGLKHWFDLVDATRKELFQGQPRSSLYSGGAFRARGHEDVMAGIAVLGLGPAGTTDEPALSWRHGSAYKTSLPPRKVPSSAVPATPLDPVEQGGAALVDHIAREAGMPHPNRTAKAGHASGVYGSRWQKVDIFLDWRSLRYKLRVNDVTVVARASLHGRGITRIGLYAVGGATAYFDQVYAGRDATLAFECPGSTDSGVDLTMDRPDQTGWGASDAGPDTGGWQITRHDSHVSRREMYQHSYHSGLVYDDGLPHTAFHSDVGNAGHIVRAGWSRTGVSGSGFLPTGSNDSTPDLLMVGAGSAVNGSYANPVFSEAKKGGVSAGVLTWSPGDKRLYWYGEHDSLRIVNETDDVEAAFYRRWYLAGGVASCSSVGHGAASESSLRIWRNEGIVLRYANLSLPSGIAPIEPTDSLTSERPEDEATRLLANRNSSVPLLTLLGKRSWKNASDPPLGYMPLRMERPRVLHNSAAAHHARTCTEVAWGVTSLTQGSSRNNCTWQRQDSVREERPGPFPFVLWASLDGPKNDYRAAGIAAGLNPRGPFYFLRGLRPSGNATVDLTLLQAEETCERRGALPSNMSSPSFLARSYFASERHLMPASIMQPMWESVKDRHTSPEALALGPPGGSNATSGYWYPSTNFALNFHRAFYDAAYDDPDDTLIQKWRREDQAWNVSAGSWNEIWDEGSQVFRLRNVVTGGFKKYTAADRATTLAETLGRHDFRHVYGQGRPPILSRYLDPLAPVNSGWSPSSVPAVKTQPWSQNYLDKNIADNAPHPTVADLLIGEERVVQVRRASYVAVSRLADDYLSLKGEQISPSDWCATMTAYTPAAALVVSSNLLNNPSVTLEALIVNSTWVTNTSGSHLRSASQIEEIAVVEGTLESLVGDDAAQGTAQGPGWLADIIQGHAGCPASRPSVEENRTLVASAAAPAIADSFGWSSSPSDAGKTTFNKDVTTQHAPGGFSTAIDWIDRHWQYITQAGDRALDFRNFKDRQPPGAAGSVCPNLHHLTLLKYAECNAILDGPGSAGPPPRVVWADGPTQLDASLPTSSPRAFSRGLDTSAYLACVSEHQHMLQRYQQCARGSVLDFDAVLPDWGVGFRECVGGNGPCGPTADEFLARSPLGGFEPFDEAAADAEGILCFASDGTLVASCAAAAASSDAHSVTRTPSGRDLVLEDRLQKAWPV